MHYALLVLGEEPMAPIETELSEWESGGCGRLDWAAIGGRFGGRLILKPGATTGRLYAEAFTVQPVDTGWTRDRGHPLMTSHQGGVDQARKYDIDWPATDISRHVSALVINGNWHEWPAYDALAMARVMARELELPEDVFAWALNELKPPGGWEEEELTRAAEMEHLMAAVPDNVLCTMIDVHH